MLRTERYVLESSSSIIGEGIMSQRTTMPHACSFVAHIPPFHFTLPPRAADARQLYLEMLQDNNGNTDMYWIQVSAWEEFFHTTIRFQRLSTTSNGFCSNWTPPNTLLFFPAPGTGDMYIWYIGNIFTI